MTDERSATPEELKKFSGEQLQGKGNRVIKFSPDGKITVTIGKGARQAILLSLRTSRATSSSRRTATS